MLDLTGPAYPGKRIWVGEEAFWLSGIPGRFPVPWSAYTILSKHFFVSGSEWSTPQYLFVCLCVYLFVCSFDCSFVGSFVCLCARLRLRLCARLSVSLYVCVGVGVGWGSPRCWNRSGRTSPHNVGTSKSVEMVARVSSQLYSREAFS